MWPAVLNGERGAICRRAGIQSQGAQWIWIQGPNHHLNLSDLFFISTKVQTLNHLTDATFCCSGWDSSLPWRFLHGGKAAAISCCSGQDSCFPWLAPTLGEGCWYLLLPRSGFLLTLAASYPGGRLLLHPVDPVALNKEQKGLV